MRFMNPSLINLIIIILDLFSVLICITKSQEVFNQYNSSEINAKQILLIGMLIFLLEERKEGKFERDDLLPFIIDVAFQPTPG
jgi:hypothetical protein